MAVVPLDHPRINARAGRDKPAPMTRERRWGLLIRYHAFKDEYHAGYDLTAGVLPFEN